ncbi:MAG TPA: hypothetical protein VIK69_01300 [Methylophilaceae bacterium]|jgi:hypothetical protein
MNMELETLKALISDHMKSGWDVPVICRVEVDLPGWLEQLTGRDNWEVTSEEEEDTYISFALRQGKQRAEVTLYHSGYAVVDVDGKQIFDGALTANGSQCAHLSYYNAENGEPITLN